MDTSTLKRLDSFMEQQINVLKQLLELVDDCENRKLTKDLDITELQQLKDYTADMMLACTTAKKLAEQLQSIVDKEDKEKATKKKETKKEVETKTKKPETKKVENTELPKVRTELTPDDNDADMDFLE